MADFEIELRNSIRSLQTEVRTLSSQTETSNRSLRQMQVEVKAVAAGHREAARAAGEHAKATESAAHEIHTLGRGAAIAGGHAGHMVHRLFALGGFNPIALAAGAGIGFLIGKVTDLISETIAARAEAEKLGETFDKLPAKMEAAREAAADKALGAADVAGMRRRGVDAFMGTDAFSGVPEDMRDQVREAVRMAIESGRARNEEEAVGRLEKGGGLRRRESTLGTRQRTTAELAGIAAGLENEDPEAFFENSRRFGQTAVGSAITAAEGQQRVDEAVRSLHNQDALVSASGQASTTNAKLDTMIMELRRLNDVRDRDRRAGATSTITAAALAQSEKVQADYNASLAQIAITTK